MKEGPTNGKSPLVMPALMGSAAGAGLALLLTPKSGERIRRDLKRFAEDTRDQVGDIIDEGRDLYEEGRKVVARAVKGGKETYNEGMDKISKLMHKKERSLMVLAVATGIIGVGAALLLMPKRGKARELESEKYYLAAPERHRS